jgi:uncharacterized repeat protein (TIGR02543 family)
MMEDFMRKSIYLTLALCAIIMAACGGDNPGGSKVTIEFDTDGGSELASIEINEGAALPASYFETGTNVPTKPSHRFNGWKNGTEAVTTATTFDENTTLTAQWVRTITVIFSLGEGVTGTPPPSVVIDAGTALGAKFPTVHPERDGYDFDGWCNGVVVYNSTTAINSSDATFTLTAKWEEEDNNIYTFPPAIHPGRDFSERYPGGFSPVKVNVQFTIEGLSGTVDEGVLSAQWYRATSEADAKQYRGSAIGEKQEASEGSLNAITLRYTGIETEPCVYWYWVEVTNYNEEATGEKYATTRTQYQLKVTVVADEDE